MALNEVVGLGVAKLTALEAAPGLVGPGLHGGHDLPLRVGRALRQPSAQRAVRLQSHIKMINAYSICLIRWAEGKCRQYCPDIRHDTVHDERTSALRERMPLSLEPWMMVLASDLRLLYASNSARRVA